MPVDMKACNVPGRILVGRGGGGGGTVSRWRSGVTHTPHPLLSRDEIIDGNPHIQPSFQSR